MASNKKNEKDVRSSYGNPSTHETMHLMFHMAGKSNADWHCKDSPVAAYLVLVNTKDAKSVLPFRIGFNLFVSGTPHLVVSQSNGRVGVRIEQGDRALLYSATDHAGLRTYFRMVTRHHTACFDGKYAPSSISVRIDPCSSHAGTFLSPLLLYHRKFPSAAAQKEEKKRQGQRKEYWAYLKIRKDIPYALAVTWPRAQYMQYVAPTLATGNYRFELRLYRQSMKKGVHTLATVVDTIPITPRHMSRPDALPSVMELSADESQDAKTALKAPVLAPAGGSQNKATTAPAMARLEDEGPAAMAITTTTDVDMPHLEQLEAFTGSYTVSVPMPAVVDISSYQHLPLGSERTRRMLQRYAQ